MPEQNGAAVIATIPRALAKQFAVLFSSIDLCVSSYVCPFEHNGDLVNGFHELQVELGEQWQATSTPTNVHRAFRGYTFWRILKLFISL